jgi:hypothetical protein
MSVDTEHLIEAGDRFAHIAYPAASGVRRPADQQHRDAEGSRGGDLTVGRVTSAVLRHHHLDGVLDEQRPLLFLAEGSTLLDVSRMRHRQWRLNRIDAANEVVMLRSRRKGRDLLPAQSEKYAARRGTQSTHGITRVGYLGPSISGYGVPGRPAQRNQRRIGLPCRAHRISRHGRRVGMGRIDQGVYACVAQVSCEAGDPTKTAAPYGHGLCQRRDRAAGQRQGHGHVGACCKKLRQLPRLGRAAKNQDMSHVAR